MKQFGIIVMAIISFLTLSSLELKNGNNLNTSNVPHINFEVVNHDYGVMMVGDNGNFSFKFKNTGGEPLIIQNVSSSCGCTVAKKPEAPIMPGATDEITVRYDTRRLGVFHKTVTITSNADNPSVVLTIKGEVKPKPQEVAPVKAEEKGFTPINN